MAAGLFFRIDPRNLREQTGQSTLMELAGELPPLPGPLCILDKCSPLLLPDCPVLLCFYAQPRLLVRPLLPVGLSTPHLFLDGHVSQALHL